MNIHCNSFKILLIACSVQLAVITDTAAQGNGARPRMQISNPPAVVAGSNTNSSFFLVAGMLWSCGDNSFGQLGTGQASDASGNIHRVSDSNEWQTLAAGSFHTIALKADGSLWAWGDNQYGQIGNGSLSMQRTPVPIAAGQTWIQVAASDYQSFAIRNDGSLWAWGINHYGQLGIGSDTALVPHQVGNSNDWKAVSAGSFHTLALKNDGSLWAWGYGADGQLGLGHTGSTKIPVQVGNRRDWELISAAGFHSFAISRDGTLWSWGDNEYGVLGTGTENKQLLPVRIAGNRTWKQVTAGFHHTAAIGSDGSLWTWGNNFSGELGLGKDGGAFFEPMQVGHAKDWVAVSAGYAHTLALRQDQTRWAWGQNDYGQLGTGNWMNQHSPVSAEFKMECGDTLPPAR